MAEAKKDASWSWSAITIGGQWCLSVAMIMMLIILLGFTVENAQGHRAAADAARLLYEEQTKFVQKQRELLTKEDQERREIRQEERNSQKTLLEKLAELATHQQRLIDQQQEALVQQSKFQEESAKRRKDLDDLEKLLLQAKIDILKK